jgi:hypothetical protein
MSRFVKACGLLRWYEFRMPRVGAAALATSLMLHGTALGDTPDIGYWLKYGKPPRLCPGAHEATPLKIEGAAWGVLASGVILCKDAGDAYSFTISYLNVAIDPDHHEMLKRDTLRFDWIGLALYKAEAKHDGIDWLFDQSRPLKGELQLTSSRRIVFGSITFDVPKREANRAANMLFYLTFHGPVVAIHVL